MNKEILLQLSDIENSITNLEKYLINQHFKEEELQQVLEKSFTKYINNKNT